MSAALPDKSLRGLDVDHLDHRGKVAKLRHTIPVGLGRVAKKTKAPSSETPGKTKGSNCQAMPKDKVFAKRNRSYKMKGYKDWCRRMDAKK